MPPVGNLQLGLTIRQKDVENRELKIVAIESLHKIGMPADDIAQRLRLSKEEVEAVIRSLPSS
jgi:replicative DNA helicase